MIGRRAFIAGTLHLLAAPLTAQPQASKPYRIGFLGLSSPADYAANLQAF